ncbi:hypothetical protein QJS04_geneDACA020532 [Acorus gramineus]|uniref:RRM domain-containing protein n=1 Tax=Acorus gramineus TaxID=55184 RepID=A0AAV9AB62_ACOGR|nr:hypothetical protein QJS04_geneDACA020532 [Acorus gramineus]
MPPRAKKGQAKKKGPSPRARKLIPRVAKPSPRSAAVKEEEEEEVICIEEDAAAQTQEQPSSASPKAEEPSQPSIDMAEEENRTLKTEESPTTASVVEEAKVVEEEVVTTTAKEEVVIVGGEALPVSDELAKAEDTEVQSGVLPGLDCTTSVAVEHSMEVETVNAVMNDAVGQTDPDEGTDPSVEVETMKHTIENADADQIIPDEGAHRCAVEVEADKDEIGENRKGGQDEVASAGEGGEEMGEQSEGNEDEDNEEDEEEDNEEEDNEENEEEDGPPLYMHPSLSGRKKEKDFEIFVGGLDKGTVEDDLINVFNKYGDIQSVRIVKHPVTQKSKGFAFVRYATTEQAKIALASLKDGTEVRGKRIGISASQDNDTLYLGNICKSWTRDHVLASLEGYGVKQIEEMFLPNDPKNEAKNKGYALLEFCSHSDAMAAFQLLRKPDAVFGRDRSAKVAFAQSSIHPSEEALLEVKTAYLEGLPASWDEDKIKKICIQFGEIEKVQLSRNFVTSKRKDFGFVEFVSREGARACVEGINNSQLGEGDVKVKANLAKPLNKGRLAKQAARGGFKVMKDSKKTGETSESELKTDAKSIGAKRKGKAQDKLKNKEGPSRLTEGQPAHQNHQKSGQPLKGHKHGKRGMQSNNSTRPPKKPRNAHNSGNFRDRAPDNYGNKRNAHFRNPNVNHSMHPVAYVPQYAAATPSYQGHAYVEASGSYHRYSEMEPHAGYLQPAVRQGQDLYSHPFRRSAWPAGYSGQGRGAPSYVAGMPPPPPPPTSYPGYSGYAGYEAAYAYPSSGTYPPPRQYY